MENKHRAMLRRRGLDPKYYRFIKSTYTSVYFRNIHTGLIKIIDKGKRFN